MRQTCALGPKGSWLTAEGLDRIEQGFPPERRRARDIST
jgi:hypothetical protein